jgi:hypothetical protein
MFYFIYLSFLFQPYLWVIVAVILGVSIVSLFSMAELAVRYEDAFLRLFNLVGLTSSDGKAQGKAEEPEQAVSGEMRRLQKEQQPTYIGDIDWSEYSPQILADISEVRYLFQSALDRETGEIANLRLLNEGMKKANEFIVKHWFELKDEDRQMFEAVTLKLVESYRKLLKKSRWEVYLFMGYQIIRTIVSYSLAKLLYKLGLKRQIPRLPIRFSKKFIGMVFKSFQASKADNLAFKFVNNQIIFANTILKLSGRYELIDESLFIPEALDKVDPVKSDGGNLTWEEQEIISDAYIRRQAALFDAIPKEKLLPYKGQYVFFEEGKIKDSDISKIKLAKRIFKKEGYRDLFLEKVV